jgi:hypothetical protein
MPKSILEFNLPEEEVERDMAHKAGDMYAVITMMEQHFRAHVKHDAYPEWDTNTVESIREILLNEMADRGINFN